MLSIETAFPYGPEELLDPKRICYQVYNNWESLWYCRLEAGADGDYDAIVVEKAVGDGMPLETPFRMLRSGRYKASEPAQVVALNQMREMLERVRK